MAKLPKAIQAQVDEAEQIEKLLSGDAAPEVENTEKPDDSKPEAEAPEHLEKPTEVEKVEVEDENSDTWKRRYEILEGKYKAEVPRFAQQIRELTTALNDLKGQVEANKQVKTEVPETKKPETLVTPKDQDAFGEDLIDLARRVTREETSVLNQKIDQLTRAIAAIASLPKQVGEIVEKQALTEDQQFWKDIGTAVPDWDIVDADPAWIAHLDTKAKYVNGTHRDLANIAIQARDVKAIVELVEDWKAQSGYKAAKDDKLKNQKELESQITPNKANTAPPPKAEAKTYTWAEYDAAYSPTASRMKSPAEVLAIQAEMEKAFLEGRIV
jgi:hypothetical protein